MKRCLCLWLPNWPVQRVVAESPELRKQRLVLFRHEPRGGQRVAAASPLAGIAGVRAGMSLSQARSLLRGAGADAIARPNTMLGQDSKTTLHPRAQHHDLARRGIASALSGATVTENVKPPTTTAPASFYVLPHDPVIDRQRLEQVADSLHAVSPVVGIEQVDAPESLLVDITGLDRLSGSESRLIESAIRLLKRQGYHVLAAAAPTIGQAWALARFQPVYRTVGCQPADQPPVAEVVETSASPESITPLSERLTSSATEIYDLPIAGLRLSDTTQTMLGRLGLATIGQLQSVPRQHLAARFGDEVSRRLDQFNGDVDEPLVARAPLTPYVAQQLLDYPTRHRETIEVVTSRLVEKVCQQLQFDQQGALQWQVRMGCRESGWANFTVSLFQATATVDQIMPLVAMQLESQLSSRRRRLDDPDTPAKKRKSIDLEVDQIDVRVVSHVLLVHRQRELFDENPRLNQQSLAQLINRLTSRLGRQCVVGATLRSGAQPEYAFRFEPLVDRGKRKRRSVKPPSSGAHALARPLRIFETPIPVQVRCSGTSSGDRYQLQAPSAIRDQHTWQDVSIAQGPERIETGWWRGPTARRDYWHVEIAGGERYWVFYDLNRQQWFLHGQF